MPPFSFVLLVVAVSTPALAQPQSIATPSAVPAAETAPSAAATAVDDKMLICKRARYGSRKGAKPTCLTRETWAAVSEAMAARTFIDARD